MVRSSLALAALLVAPAVASTTIQPPADEFAAGVRQYVELHRALEAPLGPEELCSDPEQLYRSTERLAFAIREARPDARAGDIFTPRVAAFLRAHIEAVVHLTGFDVTALADESAEEGPLDPPALEVNARFPWEAGPVMWPSMLWKLPPLPEELEYRFVGRELVLLDVRANLVVDILYDALPLEDAVETDEGAPQPCDVHPELPACWM